MSVRRGVIAYTLVLACFGHSAQGQDGVTYSRSLGAVTALASSADGKVFAAGGYQQVVIYSTESFAPIAKRTDIVDHARSLRFLGIGSKLAIGCGLPGSSGKAILWDWQGGGKDVVLPPQADTVDCMDAGKDGSSLLLGSADNRARWYPDISSSYGMPMDQHNGRVSAVAVSPAKDTLFATGGMDRFVKIWDVKTRTNIVNFDRPEAGVTGLAFLPSGNQLVGCSLDGFLYWWQVNYDARQNAWSGNNYRRQQAHDFGVNSLAMSADGSRIITSGMNGEVTVWSANSGNRVQTLVAASIEPDYAVALGPDGKLAYSAGRLGFIRIWTVPENRLLRTLTLPPLPTVQLEMKSKPKTAGAQPSKKPSAPTKTPVKPKAPRG